MTHQHTSENALLPSFLEALVLAKWNPEARPSMHTRIQRDQDMRALQEALRGLVGARIQTRNQDIAPENVPDLPLDHGACIICENGLRCNCN